jgi:hypothetical protein
MQCVGIASGRPLRSHFGEQEAYAYRVYVTWRRHCAVRVARPRCTVGETKAPLRGRENPVKQMSWIPFVVCVS